jgi:hypothetical protein
MMAPSGETVHGAKEAFDISSRQKSTQKTAARSPGLRPAFSGSGF